MFYPGLPYNPFRSDLYTVVELMQGYDGKDPATTQDAKIADYYQKTGGNNPEANVALGERIHDYAIDVALSSVVKNLRIVGIMGGHLAERGEPLYTEVARLGKLLTSAGYSVITGGGPGVMEAANLGAYMAQYTEQELANAITELKKAPSYQKDPVKYIQAATNVLEAYPAKNFVSLSVPTWAYSNEPTGQFASHIAKYFANSIREDGLLAMGTYGVIFAPGSAGTLQEIFQDAAHNNYKTFKYRASMLFLGRAFYKSIYEIVMHLAATGTDSWDQFVGTCDTSEEAVKFIQEHPPKVYDGSRFQIGRWENHFEMLKKDSN